MQLRFQGTVFQHSPVVVQADRAQSPEEVLIAAHSYDADYRPLASYDYEELRCLHIQGRPLAGKLTRFVTELSFNSSGNVVR